MARISDTIPVLYVPGDRDIGIYPTDTTIDSYCDRFGADYFGFWFNGTRILCLNSPLLRHPDHCLEKAFAQDLWFEEEIELAKLSSVHVIIFTHHPWFQIDLEEEDSERFVD